MLLIPDSHELEEFSHGDAVFLGIDTVAEFIELLYLIITIVKESTVFSSIAFERGIQRSEPHKVKSAVMIIVMEAKDNGHLDHLLGDKLLITAFPLSFQYLLSGLLLWGRLSINIIEVINSHGVDLDDKLLWQCRCSIGFFSSHHERNVVAIVPDELWSAQLIVMARHATYEEPDHVLIVRVICE